MEVKATTATRNKNKFKILVEVREMAAAAQCREKRDGGTSLAKLVENVTPEGEPSQWQDCAETRCDGVRDSEDRDEGTV